MPLPNQLPSVANYSDALAQLGYKFQTMRGIQPVFRPIGVSGPAYPVVAYAGATYAVEQALEEAPPGSVVVVNGESYLGGVMMGSLMSTRLRVRGVAGAVIDGAVRDTVDLEQAGWPMFAHGVTPRSGTHDQLGKTNLPITCGGVPVRPGDWILGDEDGVVVIPSEIKAEADAKAAGILAKETFIMERLLAGDSLGEAVRQYLEKSGGKPASTSSH